MSDKYSINKLCKLTDVNRPGFYKWRKNMVNPTDKIKQRIKNIEMFKTYHSKYPTHGYRWLNAKIKLNLGITFSDDYAQRAII